MSIKVPFLFFIFVYSLLGTGLAIAASSDPLSSWNSGKAKQSIINFVQHATQIGSKTYIAPKDRIAVFDNDGTLWPEQPMYIQLFFAIDRIRALAPQHPEWKQQEPFASLLKGDIKTALAAGEHALLEIVMASHAGMSTEAFANIVRTWIATARHPITKQYFKDMAYQPMLEVLRYMRAHGFKTYIVSGGGIGFMRPWTQALYGIPAEQVIGSSINTRFEIHHGKPRLIRLGSIHLINDKEAKVIAIDRYIGHRPVAAFGNSDGDLAMLQWTTAGKGLRFGLYLHHTDPQREWAYDRYSSVGRLDQGLREAKTKGWTIVDMKKDWKRVYQSVVSVQ